MEKIAIIIPSRLDAVRLPNKPLKLINNKEIIIPICMFPTLLSKPTVIKLNKVQK